MKKIIILAVSLFIIFNFTAAGADKKNKAKYEPSKRDKVLKEISEKTKDAQAKKEEITAKIRERQAKEKKEERAARRKLVTDMTGVYPPASPAAFKHHFHFAPVAQYMTSTCWSFSATSYFESEIFRLTGKKIKLSEMWAPYYELIEKSRRFITERGASYVAGGAESNSVTGMWKKYGVVPAEFFPGVLDKDGLHNHGPMMKELRSYLNYIEENNLWDEEDNLAHVRMILNKHMGTPPQKITYNGRTMTPLEFLEDETGLKLDDYCSTMSTTYFPFYTKAEFKVPDNWWHSEEYINLPLDVWYGVVKTAVQKGYTMIIGGDISEAGKLGDYDVAFVPTFDIPEKYIDQDSREYRIYNGTTEDDHGIHLVGYKKYKGKDWFLIKDSGRSARNGKHSGYYFFRGDFIRLKMMSYTVHKDLLKDILPKLKK